MGAKKSKKKFRTATKKTIFNSNDPKDDQILSLQQQVEQLKSQLLQTGFSSNEDLVAANSNCIWPSHNTSEAGLGPLYALFEEGKYNELLTLAAKYNDNHPHIGEIAYIVGLSHTRLNNPEQALIAYQIAQDSNFLTPYVLHNAAEACRLIQNLEEAVRLYKEALALLPHFQEAKLGLALAQRDRGEAKEAEIALRLLIRNSEENSDASFHLANILRTNGKYPEAIEAYYLCLDHDPMFPDAWNNLGLTYESVDQELKGIDCFRQALSINADFKESRQNLARALMRNKRHGEALREYNHLLTLKSLSCIDQAVGLQGKITCLLELGQYENALAVADQQENQSIRLMVRLYALPVVYQSEEELDAIRQRWSEDLDDLQAILKTLNAEDPVWQSLYAHTWAISNFYLAYQMQDDRVLNEKYCDVLELILRPHLGQFMEDKPQRQVDENTILRIGVISPHLYNHNGSIWSLGWLETMIEDPRYELFTYNLSDIEDSGSQRFASISTYRKLSINSENPVAGIQKIIDDELDFLLFTDIGMHPVSRILSVLRLAPIQAQGWGHPVTSGSKNIDIYFSGAGMEMDCSDSHYSEQLWRLPNTGLNYPVPIAEDTSNQLHERFGLPRDRPIINSLQSTFKYIPQYDWVLAEIAARNPESFLIMVNHMGSDDVIEQFKKRLNPHFEQRNLDINTQLKILPRLNHNDYMSIFLISRLTLDTIGWNGGNSSFQSFALGCPIITLPTEYMRGRHTLSMLKIMEIDELIAENAQDYINRSCLLLSDENYYAKIKQNLIAKSHRLFNDQSVASEFVTSIERLYSR